MAITARSVFIDIANNWGNGTYVGIREVDFYFEGSKITMSAALGYQFASSYLNSYYAPDNAFTTSFLLVDSGSDKAWMGASGSITNQRLYIVFNADQTFDEIRITNYHDSGTNTDRGAKDVKIYVSTESTAVQNSSSYGDGLLTANLIFNGQLNQHTNSNIADTQTITVAIIEVDFQGVKSVILDIADNWGSTTYLGIMRVSFYLSGAKLTLPSTSYFTAYATTYQYAPTYAFNSSYSLVVSANYEWRTYIYNITNTRLICVFTTPQNFDSITIDNYHTGGINTNMGAKNVKLSISTDTITNTTYNATISNSVLIFDGQLNPHVASNVADPQLLTLIELTPTAEFYDIVTGAPVLDSLIFDWIEVEDIITSSTVIDTLALSIVVFPSDIVTSSPVLDALAIFTMDIVAEVPVLDTLDVTIRALVDNIVTDLVIIGSLNAWTFGESVGIISGAPVLSTLAVSSSMGIMSFAVPETIFTSFCGAGLEFEVPDTQIDIVANTENVAFINTTISKTNARMVAVTDLLAQVAYNLPKTYLQIQTGYAITFDCPITIMAVASIQQPIVKVMFASPKTKFNSAAVTQVCVEIKFDLPITTSTMVTDNHARTYINTIMPRTKCSITAAQCAIIELAFNVTEMDLTMIGISDVHASIQFDVPKLLMATHTSIFASATVLKYTRGAIR